MSADVGLSSGSALCHLQDEIVGHLYQVPNFIYSGAVRFYDLRLLMGAGNFRRRKMIDEQ